MDRTGEENTLKDILTNKLLNAIINCISKAGFKLLKYELNPVGEGMCGFTGDHAKLTLHLKEEELVEKIHLFIKTISRKNAFKAKLVDDNNFFIKEKTIYNIFEEMSEDQFSGSNPWGVKAIVRSDNTLVLPDLSEDGYMTYPATQYFDMAHVTVTLNSLARFHAAFANYETHTLSESNKLPDQVYELFNTDTNFSDGPWLHAGVKCITNFLKEFSPNVEQYPTKLNESITKWFLDASDSIKKYEDTLNVIIHKDLWANNILFKYLNGGVEPVNAVLIDFQCARYAPPALDVMMLLYFTLSRSCLEQNERKLLNHYYSVFSESVDGPTSKRLKIMNYNRQTFLAWCERVRPGGMMVALAIYPFILLSPDVAQKVFDDLDSYQKHYYEDRSAPVIEFARDNEQFRTRLLDISEEFVERHLSIRF